MPDLTPFEERMLGGLREAKPRRQRRWLPVVLTAVAAAAVLVLTVVRPPAPAPAGIQEGSAPTAIRYLKWITPHLGTKDRWTDEVWIDDVHHTVRLKSPDFDRTFTDVPEPIALNRPGMPAEFARMSPDVLAADQRTVVADLPRTQHELESAVTVVGKETGQYNAQVLGDLLSKPGLSADMRELVVKILLQQPEVGLLDPHAQVGTGRTGALYVANIGPLSLQIVIDAATNTLLSLDKDDIVNQ